MSLIKTPLIAIPCFILLLIIGSTVFSQSKDSYSEAGIGDLIWSDDFDGSGEPDPAKWERQEYNRRNNANGPDGWWSREDSYLDGTGNLVIRVRKIIDKNADGDSCDFSVGALRSKGKFEHLYGRFEISCKLPTQPGWWVAFWMMQGNVGSVGNGGVDGTEVDIMEGFGWTNKINQAFHWDGYDADHKSIGKAISPEGIREGFHTYTMDWYPDIYIFYIDGVESWRSTGGGVCNQPGYVKVTGEISTEDWAINEWWSEHPGKATYPDSFIVDYVKVYELEYEEQVSSGRPLQAGNFSLTQNPVQEQIRINWDEALCSEVKHLLITNLNGQVLKSFSNVNANSSLSVNDLNKGMYIVSICLAEGNEYLRFIKE